MCFYAEFRRHEGQLFRLDTRIYLTDRHSPQHSDQCLAAVVAKNPGSAKPNQLNSLTRLSLDGDKLLPTVRNRFLNAYALNHAQIPDGGFVRVWNLLYLCDPNLSEAIRAFGAIQEPLWCPTENDIPEIVWFAWGPPIPKFEPYKSRFLAEEYKHVFYSDMDTKQVVAELPTLESRVKHTQGLLALPVEEHLATLLPPR